MPSFLIFCRHTLKHLRASTINSFLCKHSFLCLLPHYRTFRSYGKSVESSFVLYVGLCVILVFFVNYLLIHMLLIVKMSKCQNVCEQGHLPTYVYVWFSLHSVCFHSNPISQTFPTDITTVYISNDDDLPLLENSFNAPQP